jgi:cytochrome bd-type quinol oxidase subunit 1
MHYPWWYVPFLTSPMLIAAIAVVHVLVSHYAVGGGLFLAVETGHAYRTGNRDYLAYLKQHAWFFVLLTVAFGAITGVGIWWTIGLASPLATETLIHIFVFGWAMEYVFFVVEIASAFIFFYYWDKLDARTHVTIGWIYASSAWLSLVLITGITAFMLNPGAWPQQQNFWAGFFNPQFLPQVLARTGGAFLLSSLYVYLHAAFKVHDAKLRNMIEQRSAQPALAGAVLIVLGGLSWLLFLPASAQAALAAASVLNVLMSIVFALTIAVFVMFYIGPHRNPGWLSPGFAIMFFLSGLAAVSVGEFVREAVRKPYVCYNVVLGNQILPAEVPKLQSGGYLDGGTWTRAWVKEQYPALIDASGAIDESRLDALPGRDQASIGQVLFMHHCNDCHAAGPGYSGAGPMIRGWSREMIESLVEHPEQVRFFMPPWAGTPQEARALTRYLQTITPPYPEGMSFGTAQ